MNVDIASICDRYDQTRELDDMRMTEPDDTHLFRIIYSSRFPYIVDLHERDVDTGKKSRNRSLVVLRSNITIECDSRPRNVLLTCHYLLQRFLSLFLSFSLSLSLLYRYRFSTFT